MMASLTEMTAADLLKYFLAAIGALGGVIAFMGRWILSEVKALKASHSELERKLESEIKERHSSDLKALRAEIESKLPCHLSECPKKATYSVSQESLPHA